MNILDICTFNARKAIDQSNTFTRWHVRYNITIRRKDDDRTLRFEYQCNPQYAKPTLKGCLASYVHDAQAYEYSNDDIQEFADEFGYTKIEETIETFNACKRAYNELLDWCNEGVYGWLKEYFSNY